MLSAFWLLAAIGLASTSETPASDAVTSLDPGLFSGGCTPEKMSIRKEWRNMTKVEQKSYLKGVNCLMDLPAQTGLEATTNRFSDLQALHRALTDTPVGDIIHSVVSSFAIYSGRAESDRIGPIPALAPILPACI